MASWTEFRDSWRLKKGVFIAFAVGMLVGPFVSSYLGVQVTSKSARAELRSELIDLRASMCDARARMEIKQPRKLDLSARRDLATRFAAMPGSDTVDAEVVSRCSDKLAS